MTEMYAYGTRTLFLKRTYVWYVYYTQSARIYRAMVDTFSEWRHFVSRPIARTL